MSGFTTPTQAQFAFIYAHDHKWKRQIKEEDIEKYPAAQVIRRKKTAGVNEGQEVIEVFTDKLEGLLVEVGEREVNFEPGKENYVILLDDEGVKFRVSLKFMGKGFLDVLKRLPAVREDQPIQLGIFGASKYDEKQKKDITVSQLYIRQRESSGEWKPVPNQFPFDESNPSEMPPLEKKRVAGKDIWDPEPQYTWLLNGPAAEYQGRVSALAPKEEPKAPAAIAQPKSQTPQVPPYLGDDDDDLPF